MSCKTGISDVWLNDLFYWERLTLVNALRYDWNTSLARCDPLTVT